MTLLLAEGFDDGLMIPRGWLQSLTLQTGRNGQGYGRNAAGSGTAPNWGDRLLFPADLQLDELVIQFAFYFSGLQGNYTQAGSNFGWVGLSSDNAATNHVSIVPTGTNQLIFRCRGTTAIATINGGYVVGQWHYLEWRIKLHDTLGSMVAKIDGVEVMNQSGIDTKNAGTKTVFDSLFLGLTNGSGLWVIDDLIIIDPNTGTINNGFIGDAAVETLFPNANGDVSNGVGSDGNSVDNYLLVDEAAPSFTDYVNLAAVGDKELYQLANSVRSNGVVHGVHISSYMKNTDSGARGAGTILKSGSTTTSPADEALGSAATLSKLVKDINPDTGARWTLAEINALQVGVQVAS